jgi:hypothetical protein
MTDTVGRFHDSKAAFTELARKDLCNNWPVDRMEFKSRTGKWKSNMIDFTPLPGADYARVTLRFDLLSKNSTWGGPAQRKLILLPREFNFVTNEIYPDLLSQTVMEFLDSHLTLAEARVLSA